MKKILLAIVLIGFVTFLAGQAIAAPPAAVDGCVMARDISGVGLVCPPAGDPCLFSNTAFNCTSCCLIDKIYNIVDWFFIIIIALSILFALWGGFMLMTAAGEPEKVATGRKWITWAMIGIAVALVARAIPFLVAQLIS